MACSAIGQHSVKSATGKILGMKQAVSSDDQTGEAVAAPALVFGPFRLDRAGARLLREGLPVDIAPKP